jgi:hypothetical protein
MLVFGSLFGLLIVKLNNVWSLTVTVSGEKSLLMVGGSATDKVADAASPLPPLSELMGPVLLGYDPAKALVTFTLTVHELSTAIVPPVRAALVVPASAVAVPPQVLLKPLGVATTRLAGKLSVNPTPVSATVFAAGLVIVILRALVPLGAMPVGLKVFVVVGGATTARLAFDVFPVPASVEVMVTLLSFEPAVVPVTLTDTTQDAPAARLAPARLTVEDPSAAVAVPLHVLVRLPGVETVKPVGRLSVNAKPFTARVASVLVSVKLRPAEPLRGTVVASKALTIVGGLAAARFAMLGAFAATVAGPKLLVIEGNAMLIKPRMNTEHTSARAAGDMILLVTATTPFQKRQIKLGDLDNTNTGSPSQTGQTIGVGIMRGKPTLIQVFSFYSGGLASKNPNVFQGPLSAPLQKIQQIPPITLE